MTGQGERVITYCGGGIAASSDAFILHRLGHDDVAVYDNSLSEWAADPSLPMETPEAVRAAIATPRPLEPCQPGRPSGRHRARGTEEG